MGALKQKLDEQTEKADEIEMPEGLMRQKSYKSMSNILSAYEEVHEDEGKKQVEEESFLIYLTYALAHSAKSISAFSESRTSIS